MFTEGQEEDVCCPYLLEPARDGRGRPTGYHCNLDGSGEPVVPPHRQASFCLCSRYVRCPDFIACSADEELEDAPQGHRPRGLEATLAEAGLVLLMAGMIAFALFAMAPRPEEASASRHPSPAPTTGILADGPGESPVAASSTPALAAPPPVTSSPVPPAPVPTRRPAPSPTRAAGGNYVVRPGDTLYSIARSHGVSVDSLAKANGLADPKLLRTGQTIRIP